MNVIFFYPIAKTRDDGCIYVHDAEKRISGTTGEREGSTPKKTNLISNRRFPHGKRGFERSPPEYDTRSVRTDIGEITADVTSTVNRDGTSDLLASTHVYLFASALFCRLRRSAGRER